MGKREGIVVAETGSGDVGLATGKKDPLGTSHYTGQSGTTYFAQRALSRSDDAQRQTAQLFLPFVDTDTDTVLDFGCGTGGVLEQLPCARRLGIDVSEPAIEIARKKGIEIHQDLSSVRSDSVDLVISHHALEHVIAPSEVLSQFFRILKPAGRLVVVVPAEMPRTHQNRRWQPNESQHLYSWNPLTLGNLIAKIGFVVEDSFCLEAGYSRHFRSLERLPPLFRLAKSTYARVRSRFHTVCVASREPDR